MSNIIVLVWWNGCKMMWWNEGTTEYIKDMIHQHDLVFVVSKRFYQRAQSNITPQGLTPVRYHNHFWKNSCYLVYCWCFVFTLFFYFCTGCDLWICQVMQFNLFASMFLIICRQTHNVTASAFFVNLMQFTGSATVVSGCQSKLDSQQPVPR